MPPTLGQIDVAMLRAKIISARAPIEDRCRACVELLEHYPSKRNKAWVSRFIRKNKPRTKRGAVTELFEKLLRDRILEHRARIREKKKVVIPKAPPAATPASTESTVSKPWLLETE